MHSLRCCFARSMYLSRWSTTAPQSPLFLASLARVLAIFLSSSSTAGDIGEADRSFFSARSNFPCFRSSLIARSSSCPKKGISNLRPYSAQKDDRRATASSSPCSPIIRHHRPASHGQVVVSQGQTRTYATSANLEFLGSLSTALRKFTPSLIVLCL